MIGDIKSRDIFTPGCTENDIGFARMASPQTGVKFIADEREGTTHDPIEYESYVKDNSTRSTIKRKRDQCTPGHDLRRKRVKIRAENTTHRHPQVSFLDQTLNSRAKLSDSQWGAPIRKYGDYNEKSRKLDPSVKFPLSGGYWSNVPRASHANYISNNIRYPPYAWGPNNVYGVPPGYTCNQYYQPMVNMAFYYNWWQTYLNAQQRSL